jgi:hypothetical protein
VNRMTRRYAKKSGHGYRRLMVDGWRDIVPRGECAYVSLVRRTEVSAETLGSEDGGVECVINQFIVQAVMNSLFQSPRGS